MMGEIVQIVPHLPPPYEGLGGNALALAAVLAERHGVESFFVVSDPAWQGGNGWAAKALPARRSGDLIAALERTNTVLLHYANYAYQRRGCPVWLVEALRHWRNGAAARRLVTSFHEIHASGPPWRSSFWLRPVQRQLAAQVARCSDALVTPLPLYREVLLPWARGKQITVMPVLSTVGEPAAATLLGGRARAVAVFGGSGVRRRAYGSFRPDLERTVQALEADEVWDIGPTVDTPAVLQGVPVRRLGVLAPAQVSERLANARAGFVAYPPSFLSKSGIFAAYCAHRMLPVCAWERPSQEGVPAAGEHYWNAQEPPPGEPQVIADAARDWYSSHSLERQAAVFRDLLTGAGGGS